MPYGQLNKFQSKVLAEIVAGKVVHDLGSGDLALAIQLVKLGATKVIAIDKEYQYGYYQFPDVQPEIEVRGQAFQEMDEDIDVAFVSWPANYDNGLLGVLKRSKQIIFLGKNTDGTSCGTKDLFLYLATRKVEHQYPSKQNTLIHYSNELERPRYEYSSLNGDVSSIYSLLLLEEQAAIEMSADSKPILYRNPTCQKSSCDEESYEHPEKGMLCVCLDHYEMIQAGECRAPPLRRNIDFQSIARKILFFTDLDEVPNQDPKHKELVAQTVAGLDVLRGFAAGKPNG